MDISKIRIIVVEGPDLYRLGLRVLLGNHARTHLVAEINNIDDLFRLTPNFESDVILVDWALIDPQSETHATALAQETSNSRVLIICEAADDDTYLYAHHLHAAGIIKKSHSSTLLLEAIHTIHAGESWFDHDQAWCDAKEPSDTDRESVKKFAGSTLSYAKLSDSERRIAYWATQGLSAKEIGAQLAITEKTVRNQLSIIYQKLGIKKKIQLLEKLNHYNNFE